MNLTTAAAVMAITDIIGQEPLAVGECIEWTGFGADSAWTCSLAWRSDQPVIKVYRDRGPRPMYYSYAVINWPNDGCRAWVKVPSSFGFLGMSPDAILKKIMSDIQLTSSDGNAWQS